MTRDAKGCAFARIRIAPEPIQGTRHSGAVTDHATETPMTNQLWDHLLATASAIEELATSNDKRMADIRESIEVAYHREFDPADTYTEYVAVTLCRALNKALASECLSS